MQAVEKIVTESATFKSVLAAAKKLTTEEKHLLQLQLFSKNALKDLKNFEQNLKLKKNPIKKTDRQIVAVVNNIRSKRYVSAK